MVATSFSITDNLKDDDVHPSIKTASLKGGVSVVCSNLTKTVNTGSAADFIFSCGNNRGVEKTLLRDVNLVVNPGEILAVLGPSGGGKTTLVNILAQRSISGQMTGDVLYNGMKQTKEQIKTFANYVAAHDKLLCYLTVEETLTFAANLKLPLASNAFRARRIREAMKKMALFGCKDTQIGGEWKKGLSTGEAKRVSIAIELLDDPDLLILDEPTSGLDSALALEVMRVLRNLAREGKTIVVTLHQPRSQVYSMIDRLVLMSLGEVVYYGRPDGIKSYFFGIGFKCPEGWNPADFALDVITENQHQTAEKSLVNLSFATLDLESSCCSADNAGLSHSAFPIPVSCEGRLPAIYRDSMEFLQLKQSIEYIMVKPLPSPCSSSKEDRQPCRVWYQHFSTLCRRFSYNSYRNPVVCFVMLLVLFLEGLILGAVFFQIASHTQGIEPLNLVDFLENSSLSKMYLYGSDGNNTRPIIDVIRDGVDGSGSRPLYEFLQNHDIFTWIHNKMHCYHEELGLTGYPPNDLTDLGSVPARQLQALSNNPWIADVLRSFSTKHNETSPRTNGNLSLEYALRRMSPFDGLAQVTPTRMESDLITFLQIFDHIYLKLDKSKMIPCLEIVDLLAKFDCILNEAKAIVKPLNTCFNLGLQIPDEDDAERRLRASGPSVSRWPLRSGSLRRMLSSAVPLISLYNEYLDVTQYIIERVTTCGDDLCNFIDRYVNKARTLMNDSVTSLIYALNTAGCLFFLVANLGFASYDSLLTFPQERAVFNHESANGFYGASGYFLAKNLADLPFQILPGLAMSTAYSVMVGLANGYGQFFSYFLVSACVSFAAYGFGYMISTGSPKMEISVIVAPVFLVIWLVLAGFFLRDPDIPGWINWFKYISFYRWGYFAFTTNQYPVGEYSGTLPNELVLYIAGAQNQSFWHSILMILLLGIVFRILAYFFLTFTNRNVGIER